MLLTVQSRDTHNVRRILLNLCCEFRVCETGSLHRRGKVYQNDTSWLQQAGSLMLHTAKRDNVRLRGNHKEADTRLILHSCEAIN